MNYNSIQDIFNAGITNMTQLTYSYYAQSAIIDRNIIPDWMTHDNEKMYTITIGVHDYSGNIKYDFEGIWVLLGGITSSIYYEIGILQNVHNFFKIHWIGKFNNNSTTDDFIYDTIFWDNGNISVHIISIPTTTNEGELRTFHNISYYNSLNFPLPTIASPDITFLSLNNENYKYEIYNGVAQMYPTQFLLEGKDDGGYYSLQDNTYLFPGYMPSPTEFHTYGDIQLFIPSSSLTNPDKEYIYRFLNEDKISDLSFKISSTNTQINFNNNNANALESRQVQYSSISLTDIMTNNQQFYSINITGSNTFFVIKGIDLAPTSIWEWSRCTFYNGEWVRCYKDEYEKFMSINTINNLTPEDCSKLIQGILNISDHTHTIIFEGYNLNAPGEVTNVQIQLVKYN